MVLVRKGAADGLGDWKELAAKPPSPRVSLPRQSPERQARKAGEGSLFPVRPQRDGPVQGTATWPPGPEHPDVSMLLACLSCTPSCPCQALLLSTSCRFSPVTLPTAVGGEALSSLVLEEKNRLGEVPPRAGGARPPPDHGHQTLTLRSNHPDSAPSCGSCWPLASQD